MQYPIITITTLLALLFFSTSSYAQYGRYARATFDTFASGQFPTQTGGPYESSDSWYGHWGTDSINQDATQQFTTYVPFYDLTYRIGSQSTSEAWMSVADNGIHLRGSARRLGLDEGWANYDIEGAYRDTIRVRSNSLPLGTEVQVRIKARTAVSIIPPYFGASISNWCLGVEEKLAAYSFDSFLARSDHIGTRERYYAYYGGLGSPSLCSAWWGYTQSTQKGQYDIPFDHRWSDEDVLRTWVGGTISVERRTRIYGKLQGPHGGLFADASQSAYLNIEILTPGVILEPDSGANYADPPTETLDTDGDGIPDTADNCVFVANSDQIDADGDGIGDACDPTCTVTTETFIVPGTANPWLAGMPDGSTTTAGDYAPGQSPVQVSNVSPNSVLSVSATGFTGNCPGCLSANPDGGPDLTTHLVGAVNGIGQVWAPMNSLIGVFLDDNAPNSGPAPAASNFSTPTSRDYLVVAPALKQPFFIGDGMTSTGIQQRIVPPAGATRLMLGSMDGIEWSNNVGSFTLTVSGLCLADTDGDGVLDIGDNCPSTPNPGQEDHDGDGEGDLCDTDDDNDGVTDESDNCPFLANSDQADFDGDGIGDSCDQDDDNDGIEDSADLCPETPPGTPVDAAGCTDTDGDGVRDSIDNCPTSPNPDQRDTDGDGVGDFCTSFEWPSGGQFVIGDLVSNASENKVNFWGPQWAENNPLSAGAAPIPFKGFGNPVTQPACGSTWSTQPGASSNPPAAVPSFMAVIVSSRITMNGPVISGDVAKIVIVATEPGYGSATGHPGYGRVIAVLCDGP